MAATSSSAGTTCCTRPSAAPRQRRSDGPSSRAIWPCPHRIPRRCADRRRRRRRRRWSPAAARKSRRRTRGGCRRASQVRRRRPGNNRERPREVAGAAARARPIVRSSSGPARRSCGRSRPASGRSGDPSRRGCPASSPHRRRSASLASEDHDPNRGVETQLVRQRTELVRRTPRPRVQLLRPVEHQLGDGPSRSSRTNGLPVRLTSDRGSMFA